MVISGRGVDARRARTPAGRRRFGRASKLTSARWPSPRRCQAQHASAVIIRAHDVMLLQDAYAPGVAVMMLAADYLARHYCALAIRRAAAGRARLRHAAQRSATPAMTWRRATDADAGFLWRPLFADDKAVYGRR